MKGAFHSPKGKTSLSQHSAHGLHGPAHSTTSRTLSSSINPATTYVQANQVRKVEIGRYDGGLEADIESRGEIHNGEAAKILELDSSLAQK
jgi:aurora kinase